MGRLLHKKSEDFSISRNLVSNAPWQQAQLLLTGQPLSFVPCSLHSFLLSRHCSLPCLATGPAVKESF